MIMVDEEAGEIGKTVLKVVEIILVEEIVKHLGVSLVPQSWMVDGNEVIDVGLVK